MFWKGLKITTDFGKVYHDNPSTPGIYCKTSWLALVNTVFMEKLTVRVMCSHPEKEECVIQYMLIS